MGMTGQLDSGFQIDGATDNTAIGNVGDSLKTAVTEIVPVRQYEAATFAYQLLTIATANNKSMVSLVNASGSSVVVRLRAMRVINTQNTSVAGVVADLNLYRCTGHSGGTLLTSQTMDTVDSLNASVTGRTGATITGEAASPILHLDLSTDEWGAGTGDVESMDHTMQSLLYFYEHKAPMKALTLRANEGFTLKCVTNTTTGSFDIEVFFTVEST